MLDFQGDLTLELVKEFLDHDESRDAKALLGKLVEERGTDDMMITLADCLKDYIRTGVTEDIIREQIHMYTES
jgi:hypothetical protein